MNWRRLLPPYTGSSLDTVFGIPYYGNIYSEAWWFKPVHWAHATMKAIDRAWYFVAYRTWDKYHVVVTDLEPHYYDVDEIMFRACFALLRRYVEEELGTEPYSYQDDSSMYRGYRLHFEGESNPKAIDLWLWYKEELPALEAEQAQNWKAFRKKYGDDYLDEIKDAKLKELVEMRHHLWT